MVPAHQHVVSLTSACSCIVFVKSLEAIPEFHVTQLLCNRVPIFWKVLVRDCSPNLFRLVILVGHQDHQPQIAKTLVIEDVETHIKAGCAMLHSHVQLLGDLQCRICFNATILELVR